LDAAEHERRYKERMDRGGFETPMEASQAESRYVNEEKNSFVEINSRCLTLTVAVEQWLMKRTE
jgi:hypothetical protein